MNRKTRKQEERKKNLENTESTVLERKGKRRKSPKGREQQGFTGIKERKHHLSDHHLSLSLSCNESRTQ
jgi:hypothetical protein